MRHRLIRLLFSCALMLLFAACEPTPDPVNPEGERLAALLADIRAVTDPHPEDSIAVAIRDPETGTVLSLHGDQLMHAASTMKTPVMIEVFRRAERGDFSLDDPLLVKNEFRSIVDGSLYSIEDDSDDAIYERLGEEMTIRDLVYQMITVSSNLATNLLIDFVSADSVQATSVRLGTERMRVLRGVEDIKAYRQGLSNSATANDLAIHLLALLEGRTVSPEADAAMREILLDQQFNEMIPAGLPEGTRVAHKTGSITEIHHDAAIVYPEGRAPYVLVILTKGFADDSLSAPVGAEIARVVHHHLRGGTE